MTADDPARLSTDTSNDLASEILARHGIQSATPDDIVAFIEPILVKFGSTPNNEELRSLVLMGVLLWVLSLQPYPAKYELRLAELMHRMQLPAGEETEHFKWVAKYMRERHRLLFPALHRQMDPGAA